MKKAILCLILVTFSILNYGQSKQKDSSDILSNYARVIVKITAQTRATNKTGQSIVDKEIILALSKLKPLKKLGYKLVNGNLRLDLDIIFMGMESYYKWRENENTIKLLNMVDKRFKGYNIEITFVKQAKPE